jgi:triacylglycerol lipase
MNIVLAHGILGFKRIPILNLEYFNGVKAHLEDKFNARVLVTKVDPVAGIEKHGDQLYEQITAALRQTGAASTLDPSKKVHIIAHSMGGLDARYLLSKNENGIADYVNTLTTVGTPHTGSPMADFFYSAFDGESNIPILGTLIGAVENGAREVLGDLDIIDGLRDLTTSSMSEFNKNYPDNNSVKYFCVAGQGRNDSFAKTCIALLPTHAYIKTKTGAEEANDGLVSISSALREGWERIGEPWPFDHFQEIGHNLDRGLDVQHQETFHLGKYEEIVEQLKALEK